MTDEQRQERFWSRVDRTDADGCWEWTAGRASNGYGVMAFGGRQEKAHRIAWVLTNGPIDNPAVMVCHRCDNPPCCRPDHLFLGLSKDNSRDSQAKGRAKPFGRPVAAGRRGNIRPHRDGWRIQIHLGADPVTGKPRFRSKVVYGTRAEAERLLTKFLAEADVGPGSAGTLGMTLGQLLDAYLDHKALSVEGSTADTYQRQLAYIPDRLKAMPLAKVGVTELEQLYAHLRRGGHKRTGGPLAAKSVRNVHIVIHGAFELARRRRWVASNPAADAEVPAVPQRLPTPASAGAVPALLLAAADEHHALPVYLQTSVCAGGRRSEIHGLRWSGVDFARGAVVLRDTVVLAGGVWAVKPYTKTGGQRTVHLDPNTLARLAELHDRAFTDVLTCGLTLSVDAFVFSDSAVGDRPWHPPTTAARFKRCCVRVGLPATTRLHDLRSLMATHLIDQGVPIPVVAARLGHAQNSTTLDIYTGRLAASDAQAAEVMGRLFDGD